MAKKRRRVPLGVLIEGLCSAAHPDGADRVEYSLRWRSSRRHGPSEAFGAAMARFAAIDPDDETVGERSQMVLDCVEKTLQVITENLGRIADDYELAKRRAADRQAALKKGPAGAPASKRAPRKA